MVDVPQFARLLAGGKSEDPHAILAWSLMAIAFGAGFIVMGRQMSTDKPADRGSIFRHLSISWWERHPRLSIIAGSFWVLVGGLTLVVYLLWLFGVIRTE